MGSPMRHKDISAHSIKNNYREEMRYHKRLFGKTIAAGTSAYFCCFSSCFRAFIYDARKSGRYDGQSNGVSGRKRRARHEMGYDRPMIEQYADWIKGIVIDHDFGTSTRYRVPVWDLLCDRIPRSLILCGWALVVEMVIALPVGLLCAIKKDKLFDRCTVNLTLVLTAMPDFWLSALLILIFGVGLGILPISGWGGVRYLILPVFALVSASIAGTIRLTKSEVLEVMNERYVATAICQRTSPQDSYGKTCSAQCAHHCDCSGVYVHTVADFRRSCRGTDFWHCGYGKPAAQLYCGSGFPGRSGGTFNHCRADSHLQPDQ